MSSILFSILAIYIFIVIGFVAKMSFKERIDDKTVTLINVYFLQIFLTFWGLLIRPVDANLFFAPSIYLFIVILVLIISAFVAKKIFEEKKEYSIATVAAKLPILWAAAAAIILSVNDYKPKEEIMEVLMMGAYASIVMQLFLFGIYLYGTKITQISKRLTLWVISLKFIFLPAAAFLILSFIELDSMIKGIIFIELMVPLAIANVNFASLYDCKPKVVTALVFISSILFLGAIFAGVKVLTYL
jgi:hypothetical protein